MNLSWLWGGVPLAAMACTSRQSDGRLIRALSALDLPTSIDVRLSVPTTRCSRTPPGEPAACRAFPSGDPKSRRLVSALSAQAATQLQANLDLDALHTAALLDLLWVDSAGNSLRRAISSLRTITRLSSRPANALNDLSAAFLMRSERTGDVDDLLEAIDAAARSRALDTMQAAARYNLALGLDRLALMAEAATAWNDYLRIDSSSNWAPDARRGRQSAVHWLADDQTPAITDTSSIETIERFTNHDPEAARLLGWDDVLGSWGQTIGKGDVPAARRRLREAELIGRSLEARGGDATLADAIRRLRASRNRRTLANVYRTYADGRRAFRRGDVVHARQRLAEIVRTMDAAEPVAAWAAVYLAAVDLESGRLTPALESADALHVRVDSIRYPALAAQIQWTRAIVLLRSGTRSEAGLRAIDAARHLFALAGENANVGAMEFTAGDALQVLGDQPGAQRAFRQSVLTLTGARHSPFLHNALFLWSRSIGGTLPAAAAKLQDEDVAVATASGSAAVLADARIARASGRLAIGDTALGLADINASAALLDSVPRGPVRDWFRANLQLVRGAAMGRDPRALIAFDSAVAFFVSNDNPVLESQALVARAEARLLGGDTIGGAADLGQFLDILDARRTAVRSQPIRLTLLDAARRSIDRLTMLRVGTPREALAVLERGRASITQSTMRRSAGTSAPRAIPSNETVIDYAIVGDTLLAWVLRDSLVILRRSRIARSTVIREVADVESSLQVRRDRRRTDQQLSDLYDQLIGPIERDLRPSDTALVVILDGELSGVPFAALRDRVHQRYLIESFQLRFASSLDDVVDGEPTLRDTVGAVLLVGDPAFDERHHPGLGRLDGARREVAAVAQLYPGAHTLEGDAADRMTVQSALSDARIVHLAVHALVDDNDPSRSVLLLGRRNASDTSDELNAATIAALNLHHSPLVVLSACETGIDRAGRTGGFAGLATSFLRAGAHGVVGSLWRVDDQFVQPLMVEFHRAYSSTGDAAGALRAAQLNLLRGSDTTLRAPFAWAGFRYSGARVTQLTTDAR